jgi:hypothetical protein
LTVAPSFRGFAMLPMPVSIEGLAGRAWRSARSRVHGRAMQLR